MKIKFLGTHNAESKNSRLVTFLIDDVLAVEAGSLSSGLTFGEQAKIEGILLSHGHYDHIRDIPALAFNNTGNGSKPPPTAVGVSQTLQILRSHLMDGLIYPEFTEDDSYVGKPTLLLRSIEPYQELQLAGYRVKALPVNHPLEAAGFEITSAAGETLFYSGDTGPGLSPLWQFTSPQTLIVDTSFPSRLKDIAHQSGHLCPESLLEELRNFREIRGYLPRLIAVHLSPQYESEIRDEIRQIQGPLGITIAIPAENETIETGAR